MIRQRQAGDMGALDLGALDLGALEDRAVQRCAQCGAKFGLVRHYYMRKQFCAKGCVAGYKAGLRRKVDDRLRQWWGHVQTLQSE
jgi:ribosomal protein S14